MTTHSIKKILIFSLMVTTTVLATGCTSLKRHIAINQMADFFVEVERNPVTTTPKDRGIDYQDVSFQSPDGVNLSGWYMPSKGSDKLIIFNHFLLGNKAGAKPDKDWGNVSVDFYPIYRHLIDAGYNILAYDLRNHGESDVHNSGRIGMAIVESQDVIGSVRYAREHFPDHKLYLYSQCYGAVATMHAMKNQPEEFEAIRAFVDIQPLSADAFVTGVSKQFGIEHEDNVQKFSDRLKKKTGYEVDQLKVPDIAASVNIPTLLVQVSNDWRTTNDDIEKIFNRLGTEDKKLLWITDEDERLEGYNYFARQPEELIEWLNKH